MHCTFDIRMVADADAGRHAGCRASFNVGVNLGAIFAVSTGLYFGATLRTPTPDFGSLGITDCPRACARALVTFTGNHYNEKREHPSKTRFSNNCKKEGVLGGKTPPGAVKRTFTLNPHFKFINRYGHPHKMFCFHSPDRHNFFGKEKKGSPIHCLLSFFVCDEVLIPVTTSYSYSDITVTLVRRLQTPFKVTTSRYKLSVLEKLRSWLPHFEFYHFPFVSFSFLSFFFARLTDPLSQERGR